MDGTQSTDAMERPTLATALAYAGMGLSVLPLYGVKDGVCGCGKVHGRSMGKHPIAAIAPNGVKDATKDEAVIRRWFENRPNANIGIACGEVSGVLVIDLDGDEGIKSWEELAKFCKVETLQASTGGGLHLFFKYPLGSSIGNRTGWRNKIDIRSNNGYVVADPSIHFSGKNYEFSNWGTPIAELPPMLLAELTAHNIATPTALPIAVVESVPMTAVRRIVGGSNRDALIKRANGYVAQCSAVAEGTRNASAFKISGHLRSFEHDGEYLANDDVMVIMEGWNATHCNPPMDVAELAQAVASSAVNGTSRTRKENKPIIHDPIPQFLNNEVIPMASAVPITVAELADITIDLAAYPKPIGNFVASLSDANPILPPILHLGAAYAILGNVIGKRMQCDNLGNLYYPNVWVVGICSTASNKTGTLKPLEREIGRKHFDSLLPSATSAAMYDVMGICVLKNKWTSMTGIWKGGIPRAWCFWTLHPYDGRGGAGERHGDEAVLAERIR